MSIHDLLTPNMYDIYANSINLSTGVIAPISAPTFTVGPPGPLTVNGTTNLNGPLNVVGGQSNTGNLIVSGSTTFGTTFLTETMNINAGIIPAYFPGYSGYLSLTSPLQNALIFGNPLGFSSAAGVSVPSSAVWTQTATLYDPSKSKYNTLWGPNTVSGINGLQDLNPLIPGFGFNLVLATAYIDIISITGAPITFGAGDMFGVRITSSSGVISQNVSPFDNTINDPAPGKPKCTTTVLIANNVGDTYIVEVFNFNSVGSDIVININLTIEYRGPAP